MLLSIALLFLSQTASSLGSIDNGLDNANCTCSKDHSKILVIGGYDNRTVPIPSLEVYDPMTKTGSLLAGIELESGRAGHVSAVLPNGTVITIGGVKKGSLLAETELFDPKTMKMLGPGPSMVQDRNEPGIAVINGDVFVCGGWDMEQNKLDSCEQLQSDKWQPIANMNKKRVAPGMVAMDKNLFVLGGWDGDDLLSTAERYIPETNTWQMIAEMPTKRHVLSSAVLNGFIYACGGTGTGKALNVCERYNPRKNTWNGVASMKIGRGHFSLVALGGKLYAVGGYYPAERYSVEEYDPTINQWNLLHHKLQEKRAFSTAVVVEM